MYAFGNHAVTLLLNLFSNVCGTSNENFFHIADNLNIVEGLIPVIRDRYNGISWS